MQMYGAWSCRSLRGRKDDNSQHDRAERRVQVKPTWEEGRQLPTASTLARSVKEAYVGGRTTTPNNALQRDPDRGAVNLSVHFGECLGVGLVRGSPGQYRHGSVVHQVGDAAQVAGTVVQGGAFGQVSAGDAVAVLVGAALPR